MRNAKRIILGLVAALSLCALAPAHAATIQLRAWLSGAQVPLVNAGTGQGAMSFDTVTKVLTWSVSYTGLTGACTDAHFHGPAAAGVDNVPTVGMTCAASPLAGSSAALNPTLEAQLLSGQWYINIHTAAHPGGEIRGQVVRVRHDINGDGRSDVLWRNFATGENYLYPMNGTAILGSEGYLRTVADQAWQVAGIGDFDGNGTADVLWRNGSTGENYVYLMDGTTIAGEGYLRTVADQNWKVRGVGDFNGDGRADILWRNESTGENYVYPMDGLAILGSEGYLRTVADQNWFVSGMGDFNGDGRADILWRNESTGENYVYPMDGLAILGSEGYIRTVADLNWEVVGVADFDGDGRSDILWRNFSTGENYMYPMAGLAIRPTEGYLRTVADQLWHVVSVGDFDGDGRSDIFWRNETTGENYLYPMNGTAILGSEGYVRTVADQNWQVMGLIDYNDEGGGSSGPSLRLDIHFSGNFFGGTTGQINFPLEPGIPYYIANFQSANDPSLPASVLFTGPAGSGLTDTESVARFMSEGDQSAGFASPQRTEVPPGGEWVVNYEGEPIVFNLADPDSTNRAIIVVPTVTLDGDNVTQIQWVYRNSAGDPVSPPQAFVESVQFGIDGLVSDQTVRLYDRDLIPFATTSHVLVSPVSWSAVTHLQMTVRDNLGNNYTSHWYAASPPPPMITEISPTSAPVGNTITVTGVNFGCTGCPGGVNALRFTGPGGSGANGVSADFTIDSTTQITATVPVGVMTGPIWVQALGQTATSGQNFVVP